MIHSAGKLSLCFLFGLALHAQGVITTIAGSDVSYPGNSFSALSATFGQLGGVAVSPSGDVYFSSATRSLIVKFNPQKSSLTIVAGIGEGSYSGDGGPAVNAALNSPQQLAFDRAGNLYIADELNYAIRKIDTQGVITTIASKLVNTKGVAVAADGSVYASDYYRIVRIASGGSLTVIAGFQTSGYSGDGGPAIQAMLSDPINLAFDSAGNLYFAESGHHRIRRIAPGGIVSTFAGNGQNGNPVFGQPATASSFGYPNGVGVDAGDNVYFGTGYSLVRVDTKGMASLVNPDQNGFLLPAAAPVRTPALGVMGISFDAAGNLYFVDRLANCLGRLTAAGSIQAVAAYSPNFAIGDGGPAQSAVLSTPRGLTIMPDGALLVVDASSQRIRRISPTGVISTVAGTGAPGHPPAATALTTPFLSPYYVASDLVGGFYVSENCDITHVTASGSITFMTRDALGLDCLSGIAVDQKGNLLVVGNKVVSVSPTGKVTPIAGNGNTGFSGDGGPATAATLNSPQGIAVDANGVVYIGDVNNNRIRKVTPDGIISTLAGTASVNPQGFVAMSIDRQGNLYVVCIYSQVVEKISPSGEVTVIAGTRTNGFSGDGGPANLAAFNQPFGIAVDDAGNIYIGDQGNNRIRKILAAPPSIGVSALQVNLSAAAQGQPVSANVGVVSSVQGLAYSLSFTTAKGGDWLGVSALQGSAPGTLTIIADPSLLQAGTYNGTVTLSSPLAATPSITIAVTLQVAASQPPKLSLTAQSLSFAFTSGGGAASQQLSVNNQGGASVAFTASSTTTSGGAWLAVSPSSGNASASSPGAITVTATPGSLAPGTYSGTVTIASAATGDRIVVPVTMAISTARQKILLSQTGLTFTAVAQGGPVLPQTIGILNAGIGSMDWTAKTTTLAGGAWLSLSNTSGSVAQALLDVSFVDVQVDASALAPGTYYGSVLVSAPGAANSPQAITVVFNVLPAGSNPGPEVRPTGLVFTGLANGNSPGSQSVNLSNLAGSKQLSYGSSPTYVNGSNWLSYLPANATLDTVTPTRIVVQPDFTQLAPGIYRGAITIALTDGSIRTVGILSVLAPGGGNAAEGIRPLAASCAPNNLQALLTSSQQTIVASIGQPLSMELQLVDDCGAPVTPQRGGAAVSASFSNGDAAVAMTHTQNGRWTGTWQPRGGSPGAVVRATVTAFLALPGGKVLGGQTDLTVSLTGGAGSPVPLSVLNGASFAATGVLAPGALISVFGSGLAGAPASGSGSPLPTDLSGTQVSLGGQVLPLLYASDGQVNAQAPYGLPINTELQLQVKRGTSLSVPQSLTVAPAQPAVFTIDQSGHGQGAIVNVANVVVDAGAPAASGDTVVIYCTGLGAVSPPVAAGVPASTTTLSQTVNDVTVTIGGQAAAVAFAGLAPGFSGLYQVNAVVPAGLPSGAEVPVVLQVAGQTGPAVTIAVK